MTIDIKICGINSASAADAVLRAGAEFAGLVFFERSPRNLMLETGAALAGRMRGRAQLTALVVDADDSLLGRIAAEVKPDFFQLHGMETPQRAADIRARFGIPLIKVFAVGSAEDLAKVSAYDDIADRFLFDAVPQENATRPGGHGAAFDWKILAGQNFRRPWFLAGGLNPGNVARAIATSGAGAVDVSSGVESAPGVKSESLIAEFVAAARRKEAA
jgi:phosphoribosylanthranilate isomerase